MIFPLLDAYALGGLERRGLAYGPVRLWGSAAYVAANLATGALLDRLRPADLVWLIAGAATVASAALVAPTAVRHGERARA